MRAPGHWSALFSSRRRHTRYWRDWSSDVCSSDLEIYHLKAAGRPNWHLMPAAIAAIEEARSAGLDVTADMYPYAASGTGLTAILPPWADADGRLYQNLADPDMRARIRAEVLHPSGDWEAMAHNTTPEGVMPIGFRLPEHQEYVGRRLSEI